MMGMGGMWLWMALGLIGLIGLWALVACAIGWIIGPLRDPTRDDQEKTST